MSPEMKVFFNELFDYNFYCNKKIIEQCLSMQQVPDKTQQLFSHILNAHHGWNASIMGSVSKLNSWDMHDIKDWSDIHYENQRDSFEIVTNTESFDKRIDYETPEGRTYSNSLKDILFHIINHSTNHRGQIAVDFRNNNLEPLVLDYVFYKR